LASYSDEKEIFDKQERSLENFILQKQQPGLISEDFNDLKVYTDYP